MEGANLLGGDGKIKATNLQYLKPLIGCLFDTEIIPDVGERGSLTSLDLFVRPMATNFALHDFAPMEKKTLSDTNMTMAAVLPTPVQFAVCAFSLRIEGDRLSKADQLAFGDGRFEFHHCGDRIYFEAPIGDMPPTLDTAKDWEGFDPSSDVNDFTKSVGEYTANHLKQLKPPPIRAMTGCQVIMIMSQEMFRVRLAWHNGLRLKSTPAKVRAAIWGIKYVPV